MLIIDDRKFVLTKFDNEDELERVVIANAEYIFGPSSIYFPKSLIKTADGAGTIPDGYVIDLDGRRWYIVEAEVSQHSVWNHIAPQVAKQIIAANNPVTKQQLIEIAIDRVRDDEAVQDKFAEQSIDPIDYRRVLAEIVSTAPIIGMPIDDVKNDLREWAATLKVDVRLWIVRKYIEFNNPRNVAYEIPEEFRPVLETGTDESTAQQIARYDVSITDLIDADLLAPGQRLVMPYKPRNGEQRTYKATVLSDGTLEVLGRSFSSPSYAAVFGIQDAGSSRSTVNGWTAWRLENGATLAEIRDRFLSDGNGEPQPIGQITNR
ncbi:MAG: hypothetical protein DWQ34_05600 [Planctomycetota bacterium]|nr:MAG: hypothetical protein DWQ29_03690 [Planctomycetota bacterium]REJ95523.1 MAG: hypothetical protein DWQ34_05600 [Planctomycetota bacterium]REK21909.1 MAG: hypothetical protein DWQ41_20070 [Planctomycetota bacterium]REK32179.1 MAG: hypothetical protein DWQ45_17725 [Planctomycetota bacterium]